MIVLKVIWTLLGIGVAIQYFYWAVMFTGAWLNLNAAPNVSLVWMALGFWGAAISATELVFPSLAAGPPGHKG